MDTQFTGINMTALVSTAPFRSYWMAGYEGADHINRVGNPLSMNHSTRHAECAYDDYCLLEQFGIRTVRESIGWRLAEAQGRFDFSLIESRIDAARRTGLQIVWTLCHYGWPAGIDLESQEFVERFACFCRAAARYLAPLSEGNTVYSPMNEISYMTWGLCNNLLSNGDRRDYVDANKVKRQLVRATIAGCDAIWESNPHARILHCDPVIHVVASDHRPDLNEAAASCARSQFESWDMLRSGRTGAGGRAALPRSDRRQLLPQQSMGVRYQRNIMVALGRCAAGAVASPLARGPATVSTSRSAFGNQSRRQRARRLDQGNSARSRQCL